MEGIEPSACLVHTFCDEVSCNAELVGIHIAETFLRIWHCSRIEPYVDQVELAHHLLTAV